MAAPEDTSTSFARAEVSADNETPKSSDILRYTTEQLLNMKLETEKKESDVSADDVRKVLGGLEVSASKVKQSKPSVTFASETKDAEEDNELDEKSTSTDDGISEPEENKSKKKKKKKKKKSKTPAPTGFEEFYTDPPIEPDEHEEEVQYLYNPDDFSFEERIETCIQKYRARRKFDSERANIFNKYMILGGVDSGAKPFSGGIDADLLATGTKDEIARAAATDYVGSLNNIKFYDPTKPEHWIVDFEGVIKGFLSHYAPLQFGLVTKQNIKTCCGVIRNFLNYVILHGVCPEYTQDLLNSKIICDKAEKELLTIQQLGRLFPGSFNTACSALYGGFYKRIYVPLGGLWGPTPDEIAEHGPYVRGMPENEASSIVKTAIAFMGNKEMSKDAAAGTIHIIREETRSFEIIEIIRAELKVKDAYAGAKDIHDKPGGMAPLGIMRVKHFDNPDCDEEDRSEDGTDSDITNDVEDFWVEDDILEHCFIGLRMKVLVHELNIGLKYFDEVSNLYCSFLTVLPQEKMENWKEATLSTRPGPTVDNPEGHLECDDDLEDGGNGDVGKSRLILSTNLDQV